MSIEWELSQSVDQSTPSIVEDLRNSITFIINQPVGMLTFYALAFLEFRNDEILSESSLQQQYIATISYKPDKKLTFSLSGNFTDNIFMGTNLGIDAGFGFQFDIYNKLMVNAIYNYVDEKPVPEHNIKFLIGYNRLFNVPVSKRILD